MEILDYNKSSGKLKKILNRSFDIDVKILKNVKKIVARVKKEKNKAVIEYTLRYDRFRLTEKNMTVDETYFDECLAKIKPEIIAIINEAIKNITAYHQYQACETWIKSFPEGVRLGQKITPIDKVGVYIPGGKAFYPSSMLMNIIPAQIAGVKEIVPVTPPALFYKNPLLGATLKLLGIKKAYLAGGAQAIAALAFGTETIPKVDKIVGPGSIHVALAKREVYGFADIDMIAGPSEVLVLADESANPEWVALDLLSQSEHRTGFESSILITDSRGFAEKVNGFIDLHLKGSAHESVIRKIMDEYGAIILVDSILQGTDIVNTIAPEHLEIIARNEEEVLGRIRNAGAIFLGGFSSEPVGDYWAGPNHVLPTGGTARFFSPLGVYDFFKRSSLVWYTKEALVKNAEKINAFAIEEDLYFHGKAVLKRFEDVKGKQ